MITRRKALIATGAALLVSRASAYTSGSMISAPDPFIVTEVPGSAPLKDTNAKTLVSSTLNGGLKNCVLLIAGQSNAANNGGTPYTPTNSTKVDNFNIYDGATYRGVDPMLGCDGTLGNYSGRLADKLINAALFDRVILVTVAIDGTTVADWATGTLADRIPLTMRRLAARGLPVTAALWGQGESDHGTSQVNYQSRLGTIITNSRNAGLTGPWFIAKQTWLAGAVDATIQAAQLAMVDHPNGIWAGPNADSLDNTNRRDGTHFNATGDDAYAGLGQTALHAFGPPF